jgi:hypothetical protein
VVRRWSLTRADGRLQTGSGQKEWIAAIVDDGSQKIVIPIFLAKGLDKYLLIEGSCRLVYAASG